MPEAPAAEVAPTEVPTTAAGDSIISPMAVTPPFPQTVPTNTQPVPIATAFPTLTTTQVTPIKLAGKPWL